MPEPTPATDVDLAPPPVVAHPLFFLDYDGTLAPIVDDPKAAFPHPDAPALIERLAAQHPLWIITGRYLDDLSSFLDHPFQAIGLHGMQEGTVGGPVESTLGEDAAAALAEMRAALPSLAGVRLEEKGPTFAVHYRGADDEAAAVDALEDWLAGLPDALEPIRGKKVVELRPRGVSKGVAVRRLAAQHPDRTPLYLGDDVTDEDAFAALPDTAVTIKIGDGPTRARYRLENVEAVVQYLDRY